MGEVAQPAPHNMKQDEEADCFQRHSDALDDMKALDMVNKFRTCTSTQVQAAMATL